MADGAGDAQADAVAIAPGFGGVEDGLGWGFDAGVAEEVGQDGLLEAKLRGVVGQLVVAAAAGAEVRAGGGDAVGRGGEDAEELSLVAGVGGAGFDGFAGEGEGDQDGGAAGRAGEAVAAVEDAIDVEGFAHAWGSYVGHVEQAEAREGAGFEQTLVQELLLDLAELDGVHLGAVGSELAVGLRLEVDELVLGGGGCRAAKSFSSRTVRVRSRSSRGRGVGLRMVAASSRRRRAVVVRVETHISEARCGGTRSGGGFESGGVLVEVGGDAVGLEAGLAGFGGRWWERGRWRLRRALRPIA